MCLFLTSAGFDNKKILNKFKEVVGTDITNRKILFVPTAAINEGGKAMLPFCKKEISEIGIKDDNIVELQIEDFKSLNKIEDFCAIYVAGGDTKHLVQEMQKNNFKEHLDQYLKTGGIYFGVSAGSIALTNSFDGCLNYINCKLNVHKKIGNKIGKININQFSEIDLTDNQAIIIQNEEALIYE